MDKDVYVQLNELKEQMKTIRGYSDYLENHIGGVSLATGVALKLLCETLDVDKEAFSHLLMRACRGARLGEDNDHPAKQEAAKCMELFASMLLNESKPIGPKLV